MSKINHYIQWQSAAGRTSEQKISDVIKHFASRYELGTAVIITENSEAAHRTALKMWRKLTRQAQNSRENKFQANEILQLTRTISRMQRVKFSIEQPEHSPDSNLYILQESKLDSIPNDCYTVYCLDQFIDSKNLTSLPADSLVVSFTQPLELHDLVPKKELENKTLTVEKELINWLKTKSIEITNLKHNMEKANEALDTLLSSSNTQSEFLIKTQQYLHLVQLAQPLKLSDSRQSILESLKNLEQHVRVLSPAFLTDHIKDSSTDDSFLLRDPSTGQALKLESLKQYISAQYLAGRSHLAKALEQNAGFIRL